MIMKHSTIIFGKDLYQLQYTDIQHYFVEKKDETLNLEFKSYVALGSEAEKEKTIKKSVCGLLNSDGGIIIWGAPVETRDANNNTSAVGDLTPFPTTNDKDRLINKISSSITPLPVGIRVQELKSPAGDSIFIIEVDKSIERPHQFENLYYVRLDGQTRIAPHYLISALMKSVDFPILRGHIKLKKIVYRHGFYYLTFTKLLYNTSVFNNELNVNMRIVAIPGTIFVNNAEVGSDYNQTYPNISNGKPLMSNFILRIDENYIHAEISIVFQFGGDKSPSKVSNYRYHLDNISGQDVKDDEYLIEISENKLPSEVTPKTDDENIQFLLSRPV